MGKNFLVKPFDALMIRRCLEYYFETFSLLISSITCDGCSANAAALAETAVPSMWQTLVQPTVEESDSLDKESGENEQRGDDEGSDDSDRGEEESGDEESESDVSSEGSAEEEVDSDEVDMVGPLDRSKSFRECAEGLYRTSQKKTCRNRTIAFPEEWHSLTHVGHAARVFRGRSHA
jgi:hypothetical protein